MDFPDLTRQQRNLARLSELFRLEHDKNVVLKSLSEEIRQRIDMKQAILFLLDHVMVHSGLGLGADPDEAKAAVAEALKTTFQGIPDEAARKVSETVYSQLLQPDQRSGLFRKDYFDCKDRVWRWEEFSYMRLVVDDLTGKPLLRLGDAGAIIHVGMLDLDDAFAAEIEAEIIRRAIERGRYDDAVDAARRALKRSQKFRADLVGLLIKARRSLDGGGWVDAALPVLEEARTHLESRQEEDQEIIAAVDNKIGSLAEDPKSLAKAAEVRELVLACQHIHAELFVEVCQANDKFRKIQLRAFAARRVEDALDPETGVLMPLLEAPLAAAASVAKELTAALSRPAPPRMLDLADFWRRCADEQSAEDIAGETQSVEEVPLEHIPPLFEEDFIRKMDSWLLAETMKRGALRIDDAVEEQQAGISQHAARCAALLFLHHYQHGTPEWPEHSSSVLVFHGHAPWSAAGMAGDLLEFRPRQPPGE
ncbi:MAG: hypothetical protein ACLFV8_00890 [Alphaproteobacteria bacterium]